MPSDQLTANGSYRQHFGRSQPPSMDLNPAVYSGLTYANDRLLLSLRVWCEKVKMLSSGVDAPRIFPGPL
jgi:hypothetical protein